MSVTFPQVTVPTNWGFQSSNFTATSVQTQYTTMDISDKLAIGGRGLVSGVGISMAIRKTLEKVAAKATLNGTEVAAEMPSGMGIAGRSIAGGLRRSLLIGGVVSAATNLYQAITGKVTAVQAGGNMVADTATSVVGTVAATCAAGLVAGAIGAPGILMTGATFLVGTAVFVGIDALMHVSGVHKGIADMSAGVIQQIVDFFRKKIGPGGV